MKTILLSAFLLLFILDLNARIIYVEPVRNAKYVSIENNIIIGFDEAIQSNDLSSRISVTGSLSGIHSGKIIITQDKKKIIFKPDLPFAFGETVDVKLNRLKTNFSTNNNLKFSFQTQTEKVEMDYKKYASEESDNSFINSFVQSDNSDTSPPLTVNIFNNPAPGHILLNNPPTSVYNSHISMANNDGSIYHSQQDPPSVSISDFSRQPNGLLTYNSYSAQKYYGENSSYIKVDSFYTGNGYITDGHELRVLNNGHALLISYDPEPVNMSLVVPGGNPNAIVIGLIIQEIDEHKNVVFQWRSWDHFNIVDAIYADLTASTVDYVHGNAIEFDNDGNIMISSRHLSEITKINRATGEIMWRMGGVNNQFTFVNDTIPFHYQHHIRRIANGNITLFDNGNFRTPSYSRALEYHLDEVNKVATLVWQYKNSPVIYGASRGSVQRLRNGNTLICWGAGQPNFTEVTPSGQIALEMTLPPGILSYRVFRDEVNLTLNVKIAIEGFYNNLTDKLETKDTLRAYVRSAISPFGIIDSAKSVVDSVNFNGNFRFYNVPTGTYYFSTKHRNGLETWSKAGGESFTNGGVYQYDFTNIRSNAFGRNLVRKGSKYCVYSGDVNQDNNINQSDLVEISNDALNYVSGYVNTDVNGDYNTDLDDELITYNNVINFVAVVKP